MKEVIFVLGRLSVGKTTLIDRLYHDYPFVFETNNVRAIKRTIGNGMFRYPYTPKPVRVDKWVVETNSLNLIDIVVLCHSLNDDGYKVTLIKL